MDDTQSRRLVDVLNIMRLKSRYCRCIDLKQWDTLPALFTTDARFAGFAAAPDGADVETYVKGVARRLEGSITVHHCHQPDIVLTGTDTARGIWAMMDYNEWPHPIGIQAAPSAPGFCGYGYYEEEYRRIGDEWRISFMRLTRLRVDPLERRETPQVVAHGLSSEWQRPSPDWLGGKL